MTPTLDGLRTPPWLASASATRRAFLQRGTLLLAGASSIHPHHLLAAESASSAVLRIGLVTDLHYADRPPSGSRHYRETPAKLAEAAETFRGAAPDFIVQLGDFIDAADTVDEELGHLRRIVEAFAALGRDRHHVLGNHCVFTLTKEEFLGTVGQPRSYYSFDAGDFHFVVLDACFRSDGTPYGRKNFEWTDPNIPADELEWLAGDLEATHKKTIVFAHQRLDRGAPYGVKNAPAVRKTLEESGRVLAVFQGHSHHNDYRQIGGIHYATVAAMVEGAGQENNAFAVLEIHADKTIRVDGFRRQHDYEWPA